MFEDAVEGIDEGSCWWSTTATVIFRMMLIAVIIVSILFLRFDSRYRINRS